MKIKFSTILIYLLLFIHGISYAQEIDSKKNENTVSSHNDNRAMRKLFQYNNRKAEAKSLLEKQQVYFDRISNYFEKDGNIKSIFITSTRASIAYTGQIIENDYEELRNNLKHISKDSDFFEWGIRVSYWRNIINNKMHVAIYDPTLLKESDGYWCSEYFIYDKDDLDGKDAYNPSETSWEIQERINSNWFFEQSTRKISYANNNYIKWGKKEKKIGVNEWGRESNLLSFERVKELIENHSNEFNEFAKILNKKDSSFYYYRYLDYKYTSTGKRYENYNEFTFQNRKPIPNFMNENPNQNRGVAYCKSAEDFIRILDENNLVLSAGISIDCKQLSDGKSSMKIFTRTKTKDDQCLNVTITYDETGTLRERDKSIKELIPGWYYKSEIGKIQGLNAAE